MEVKVGVIILNNPKAVDRIFTYLAPSDMKDKIKVGSRVLVPFGTGNRTCEGYVMSMEPPGDAEKLKYVEKLYDDAVFDKKGAQLIEYIRNSTVCTYGEAIRLLIPAGYGAEIEKIFLINPDADIESYALAPELKKVIELVENSNLSAVDFKKKLNKEKTDALEFLIEKNIIISKIKTCEKVSEKTHRVLFLPDKSTAADYAASLSERSKKQRDIIFYLLANEKQQSESEVLLKTGANRNAVLTLEKNGIIKTSQVRVMRNPLENSISGETEKDFDFTHEQEKVYNIVSEAIDKNICERFLLHGVTGAGKTEVFIRLIRKCIKMGKTAIVLVPEISLTPMMTQRFSKRFGKQIAILHSKLSIGERLDEWDRINSGEAKVVLGARSGVFAPLKNIGIIIIDEEHEMSYKSENAPRYHTRDIAFFRGEQWGASVLMASATPLVESYYKAQIGEYKLLEIKERFNKNALPQVFVCDMRQELEKGNRTMFSYRLAEEMLYNKKKNEQVILLLNRRGFSTFVSCRKCGFVASCPHCNISLTYHKNSEKLCCHYCGYTVKNYSVCPECSSSYIKYFGSGTQKLEEEINNRFSDFEVLRMDVDTTGKKNSHEKILNKFSSGEADVLMGTQMVAKGLDFPKVTLVGVMAADTSLYIDDYRSSERTFSLIEQVIGRAGRADLPGRAVIQTYSPENSVIEHVKNHDYMGFFNDEIKLRKVMHYPPFCRISTMLVTGKNEQEVKTVIQRMFKWLKGRTKDREDVVLIGPAAATIGKIKDKFRYRIIIKYNGEISDIFREAQDGFIKGGYNKTMTLALDRDPVNLS